MAVISIAIASLKIREVLGRFSQSSREHHVADVITRELRDVTPDDERWAAKFKVLKARAPSSRDELSELGTRMKALKAESRR